MYQISPMNWVLIFLFVLLILFNLFFFMLMMEKTFIFSKSMKKIYVK